MTTKWISNSPMDGLAKPPVAGALEDKTVVLLLYGKNSFGDKIYSYIKITLDNIKKLKTAIQGGKGFSPSDFGEVVAAGRGEPTDAVRNEIASMYQVLDAKKGHKPMPTGPAEKKAWDEY